MHISLDRLLVAHVVAARIVRGIRDVGLIVTLEFAPPFQRMPGYFSTELQTRFWYGYFGIGFQHELLRRAEWRPGLR
jgi:hypothetical protein